MDELLRRVRGFCTGEGLIGHKERIVVGLSGGADSVCLLLMLGLLSKEMELKLTAVHVHHGIRKGSADRDLEFADRLCRANDVEFVPVYANVPKIARQRHQTVEEAGRAVRYEAFEKAALERKAGVIAVAHHMDDQAETVLMNLLRGSGIKGCAGIPASRQMGGVRIVRPLMCLRRKEIEAWLNKRGQEWCTDETNAGTDYLRSRMRNCLMPMLENSCNAKAVQHLAAAAQDFREADEYFGSLTQTLLDGWQEKGRKALSAASAKSVLPPDGARQEGISCAESKKQVYYPVEELAGQPPILQRYLVQEGIGRCGGLKDISREHVKAVLDLVGKTGYKRVKLPGNRRARLLYGWIVIEAVEIGAESGDTAAEKGTFTFTVFPLKPLPSTAPYTQTDCGPDADNNPKSKKIPQSSCVNWFDYDTITRGLTLRRRRPGDRICVRSDGSTQKLSDYMINARIPAYQRDSIPVLACGSDILWVPGWRMSEKYKVTDKTRMVLQVSIGRLVRRTEDERQDRGQNSGNVF